MCHYIRWRGAEGTARQEDAAWWPSPFLRRTEASAEAKLSAPKAELSS